MSHAIHARHYDDDDRHDPHLDASHLGAGQGSGRAGRLAHRFADGFAALAAVAATGAVIANIFFLQHATLRSASTGATTVSVEPKARASASGAPGTPAMIFGPPSAATASPPAPARSASVPVAPPPAAAPVPADVAALLPPASLPTPRTPSPLVADIQRELARRGFYDGTVDGLSGPRTEAAVRAFEQAARLRVSSGEPNETVMAELRRVPAAQAVAAPTAPAVARPVAAPPAAAPSAGRPMLPPAAVPGDAGVTGSVRPPSDLQAASPRILSVQKALARLGYGPIKLDGQPGTETRLAIQRFERDRNLPATGDISDRMMRELAAVSGAPIE
ncbi:peptidoglycan-binding protein [Aquabacter cavernae]|uniref:peptidoglycan-binding domain-containing protein n=1 Tax=Aquabacter cavernae TaxID=2496029 RepID=UPI000F8F4AE7|nr:peptidoglycan-binding protein [Aquabacter cavernae]